VATFKGAEVGRYKIKEKIGDGGLAVVYKATDTHLDTEVAVKFLMLDRLSLTASGVVRKRFKMEAQKMAQLSHANIVRVMDFGVHQGTPFLVMPYMAGGSLYERLGKPIPWRDALMTLRPIAEALSYTHRKSMVHRDIKPSNILITDSDQPMLSDFGIVKIMESEETMDLTGTSMGMGTAEYMAPEQADSLDVDARADVYAMGVVLFEMITGSKPFPADKNETAVSIMIKHARDPLPSVKELVPTLPDDVVRLIETALEKEPINRYQDMTMFLDALVRCLGMAIVPIKYENEQKSGGISGKLKKFGKNAATWLKDLPRNVRYGILGFSALIIISLISVPLIINSGNNIPEPEIYATETAQAETQMAQVVDTQQPTPSPSPEPTAICEVFDTEAVLPGWQESFCQTFSEDGAAEDWKIQEVSERVAVINAEVYKESLSMRAVVKQTTDNFITAPANDLRDFMVTVEGRLSSYSGNPYHEWGMVLKESEDGYYIFKIDSDKRFYFQLVRGDDISNLSIKNLSEVILPLDQTNRLTVLVDNYVFKFYINGELAEEIKDNRWVQGNVGVYMKMGGNTTVDWEFDNFAIYTP